MREIFKPALRQAHGEAVAKKRRAIPEPLRPFPAPGVPASGSPPDDAPSSAADSGLPPFLSASYIRPSKIVLPPILIENLLHRGCKMVLAGGSKSYKSWSLIDLGLSVAVGNPWWGMRCQKGVVLYVNFELMQGFLEWRIHHICQARGFVLPDWFLYWNLRHKCYDLGTVADVLRERIAALKIRIDLIIIDPIYKAIAGLDENSASDMHQLMMAIEDLSDQTEAAVVFGAHFSKGGQAASQVRAFSVEIRTRS
jgi:RecA-family ATPase